MEYLSVLSEQEAFQICSFVPELELISAVKKYRKHLPKEVNFKNISSKDEIISLVVRFRDQPEMSAFYKCWIANMVSPVKKAAQKLMEAGNSVHQSLLSALHNSPFENNPELYFKLTLTNFPREYTDLMKAALHSLRAAATDSQSSETEAIQSVLDRTRNELKSTQSKLNQLLYLSERGDITENQLDDNAFPYQSLCKVEGPNQFARGIVLRRVSVISDGIILSTYLPDNPDMPKLYDNSPMVYKEGFIGVWDWKLTYNPNSGRTNHVQSCFSQCPAEIIIINECKNVDELKEKLITGISITLSGEKVLLSCFAGNGSYSALLCRKEDINVQENFVCLNPDVFDLPVYDINEQEIIQITGKYFYRKLSMGIPKARLPVKDPLEVVRRKLLERARKAVLQPLGISNNQRQIFKQFLSNVPLNDLYVEISHECGCSTEEAKQYTASFIEKAELYFSETELDDGILSQVIMRSSELTQKCKKSLEEEWKRENALQLTAAASALKERLEKTAEQDSVLQEKMKQCESLEERLKILTSESEKLENTILQRQKIADEIGKTVSSRLENAKQNAADFAAEILGLMPFFTSDKSTVTSQSATPSAFVPGQSLDKSEVEELGDYRDFLVVLQENMLAAGIAEKNDVSETLSHAFANYLYVSFINQFPLLLAGPGGRNIVDAFSCARYGRTAAVIDCALPYTPEILSAMEQCEDKVVVALNPLHPAWISHLPELAHVPGKTVFAIQPFAEDLFLEPRGVYNYFFPVLTELLISSPEKGRLGGGNCGENYRDWSRREAPKNKYSLSFAESHGFSMFTASRLRKVLSDFEQLFHAKGSDLISLFALFPYAYVTGQATKLIEQKDYTISEKAIRFFDTYIGNENGSV